MKIRIAEAESFHGGRETDGRTDATKLIAAFQSLRTRLKTTNGLSHKYKPSFRKQFEQSPDSTSAKQKLTNAQHISQLLLTPQLLQFYCPKFGRARGGRNKHK
jgi:hypothetical protein